MAKKITENDILALFQEAMSDEDVTLTTSIGGQFRGGDLMCTVAQSLGIAPPDGGWRNLVTSRQVQHVHEAIAWFLEALRPGAATQ